MKKMMIAACAVALASVSQAAYVNWTLAGVVDKSGNALTKGVVYMFADTDTIDKATFLALTGKGATAVQEFMDNANYTYKYSDLSAHQGGAGDFGMFANNMGAKENTPTNGDMGMTGGTAYNMLAVIFDTDTITADSNFYVSDIKKTSTYADATESARSWSFGAQSASATSTNWHAVAAPEPTSGLLLLLGVAGLALKRKRA